MTHYYALGVACGVAVFVAMGGDVAHAVPAVVVLTTGFVAGRYLP